MRQKLLALLFVAPMVLSAEEAIPYIERTLVPNVHASLGLEGIAGYTRGDRLIKETTQTVYLDGGLSFAPYPYLNIDLSASAFKTNQDPATLEAFSQTLSFLVLDDTIGDPFALSIAASVSEVLSRPLRNPVAFRKGLFEFELRSAQAIEREYAPARSYRLFAMEGLGFSEAALWLKAVLGAEFLSECGHRFGSKLVGSYGFGDRTLCLHHFHGYGSLAFRTIDYALYYQRRTDDWTYYTIELLYRAYSKNAPARNFRLETSIEF
jgi:hypothetical protein